MRNVNKAIVNYLSPPSHPMPTLAFIKDTLEAAAIKKTAPLIELISYCLNTYQLGALMAIIKLICSHENNITLRTIKELETQEFYNFMEILHRQRTSDKAPDDIELRAMLGEADSEEELNTILNYGKNLYQQDFEIPRKSSQKLTGQEYIALFHPYLWKKSENHTSICIRDLETTTKTFLKIVLPFVFETAMPGAIKNDETIEITDGSAYIFEYNAANTINSITDNINRINQNLIEVIEDNEIKKQYLKNILHAIIAQQLQNGEQIESIIGDETNISLSNKIAENYLITAIIQAADQISEGILKSQELYLSRQNNIELPSTQNVTNLLDMQEKIRERQDIKKIIRFIVNQIKIETRKTNPAQDSIENLIKFTIKYGCLETVFEKITNDLLESQKSYFLTGDPSNIISSAAFNSFLSQEKRFTISTEKFADVIAYHLLNSTQNEIEKIPKNLQLNSTKSLKMHYILAEKLKIFKKSNITCAWQRAIKNSNIEIYRAERNDPISKKFLQDFIANQNNSASASASPDNELSLKIIKLIIQYNPEHINDLNDSELEALINAISTDENTTDISNLSPQVILKFLEKSDSKFTLSATAKLTVLKTINTKKLIELIIKTENPEKELYKDSDNHFLKTYKNILTSDINRLDNLSDSEDELIGNTIASIVSYNDAQEISDLWEDRKIQILKLFTKDIKHSYIKKLNNKEIINLTKKIIDLDEANIYRNMSVILVILEQAIDKNETTNTPYLLAKKLLSGNTENNCLNHLKQKDNLSQKIFQTYPQLANDLTEDNRTSIMHILFSMKAEALKNIEIQVPTAKLDDENLLKVITSRAFKIDKKFINQQDTSFINRYRLFVKLNLQQKSSFYIFTVIKSYLSAIFQIFTNTDTKEIPARELHSSNLKPTNLEANKSNQGNSNSVGIPSCTITQINS